MSGTSPTPDECQTVLEAAIACLARDDGWDPVDYWRLHRDLDELRLVGGSPIHRILRICLREIRPEHYRGYRPPQPSYEEQCRGAPMYAFVWDSTSLGRRMYIKFCFADNGRLCVVSFHKDRGANNY